MSSNDGPTAECRTEYNEGEPHVVQEPPFLLETRPRPFLVQIAAGSSLRLPGVFGRGILMSMQGTQDTGPYLVDVSCLISEPEDPVPHSEHDGVIAAEYRIESQGTKISGPSLVVLAAVRRTRESGRNSDPGHVQL